ncbi:MAG: hypothetical protein KDE62_17435, partial [Calditrichaeota bacterium]|nr:hypothetical protein [Calditrichota bacterium]
MTKLTPIAVAVLVASASTVATANTDAPAPPTFYDLGPTSPLTNETDISYAERKAYAGLEALMTILEARVHDWGCSGGPYDVEVVADFEGVGPNADATNYAKLDQVALLMDLAVEDPLRGQTVNIAQDGAMGTVGGKLVTGYTS